MEAQHNHAPSPALRLRWDVFISFIADDSHNDFIQRLSTELEKKELRVFRVNSGLTRAKEISPGAVEAIRDSAASIVVFSSSYAASPSCLEEVAEIWDCQHLILPVFYGVDPSHVRRQTGPFAIEFRNHEEGLMNGKLSRWRNAMEKIGGLSGSVVNSREGPLVIQSLVERALGKLSNTPLHVGAHTVGLHSRVEVLLSLLEVKSNGVRVLGLQGIGGIGKTTLAKALYNKLVGHFEYRIFISNVKDISKKPNGLVSLQNELIKHISSGATCPIDEIHRGITEIKGKAQVNKVLVVLDDIDDVSQLDALVGRREWFAEGSRIIFTSRDKEVLLNYPVNELYEVRELNSTESMDLFIYHALKETPTEEFLNLSKQFVALTGGLPLALEIFGSSLISKRRMVEWDDALQKLKRVRPRNLQDVLKLSFDALNEEEKCIFLDISCFFVNEIDIEYAVDMFRGCNFEAEKSIANLRAKSLIRINENNKLWMHDQIRDMGNQIVADENHLDFGMRSRLWDHNETLSVLKSNKGTTRIQGIGLDFEIKTQKIMTTELISSVNLRNEPNLTNVVTYMKEVYKKHFGTRAEEHGDGILCTKSFEPMDNLRLLRINHAKLEGGFKGVPAKLKWLQWRACPLKSLPSDFGPQELAFLDLSDSLIERVWSNHNNKKVAENLRVLNLQGCYNLKAIPDLSEHRVLQKLILDDCRLLTTLHKSLGNVTTLLHLSMRRCSNLVEFPSHVSGLKHLQTLTLTDCSKLKELPQDMSSMISLRELLVDGTAVLKLPDSLLLLTELETLSLNYCRFFKRLPICIGNLVSLKQLSVGMSALEEVPDSIGSLVKLQKLSLAGCNSLTELPESVGNMQGLTELSLPGSSIKKLPDSVGSLSHLNHLSVANCGSLTELPDSIAGLTSVVQLCLGGTKIERLPYGVGALKMIKELEIIDCQSLNALPESIGGMSSLTSLFVTNSSIIELPGSIGQLENLIVLNLNKCRQLYRLSSSFGNLKSLRHLYMEETALTELPDNFGMLSQLVTLKMGKKPFITSPGEVSQDIVLPTSFSNLASLEELDAHSFKICGVIPDDFEKLSSLETLNLGHNKFSRLPSSLSGLFFLKKLLLPHCKELKSLPPLPTSLLELDASQCTSLESIHDLSNLASLNELNLTNCEKIDEIPGLEHLVSLRRLYASGCNAYSSNVRTRLGKVVLKNLRNLALPGSKIPNWFSKGAVRFAAQKNRALKAVVIAVVVCINDQIADDLREELPALVDVQAKIMRLGEQVFTTVLILKGVPKPHEDQIHICRYLDFHPLVSILKDGDEICVESRNPPFVKGVELKKCGIHMVFENDDDNEQDEESLDETQLSVSQKLSQFFRSYDEDEEEEEVLSNEVEYKMRETEETSSSNHKSPFSVLSWPIFFVSAFVCISISILLLRLI